MGDEAALVRRKVSLLLVFLATVLSLGCGAGAATLTLDPTAAQTESVADGHEQHDSPAQPKQPHLSHWSHARVSSPPSTSPGFQPVALSVPVEPVTNRGYHPVSSGAIGALIATRSPAALQVFRS